MSLHNNTTTHLVIKVPCIAAVLKYRNDPMEQSPTWEANSHSSSQEIPQKVHYSVHKSPQMVPPYATLIQSTPSHSISLRSILILSSHLTVQCY